VVFNVELPHVGESVTEAVIGKWLKAPGDQIEKYDPLVEVITDKVNMDVPSPASGTITKIIAQEGETVLMGAVIAEMKQQMAKFLLRKRVNPLPVKHRRPCRRVE